MQNAQPRRHGTIGATQRRPMSPPKVKAWSHQDDLLAMRGKRVKIYRPDGQSTVATLLEADQFALKIRTESQSILIAWKHDLAAVVLEEAIGQ